MRRVDRTPSDIGHSLDGLAKAANRCWRFDGEAQFAVFSIVRFLAALATLADAVPKAIEQYRNDPAGFMRAQRIAGLYIAYCAIAIAIMLFLAIGQEPPSKARSGVIVLFVMLWIGYGGIWLGRLLPRSEEAPWPAWLDKRPSFVDVAMIAAIAGSFLWTFFL